MSGTVYLTECRPGRAVAGNLRSLASRLNKELRCRLQSWVPSSSGSNFASCTFWYDALDQVVNISLDASRFKLEGLRTGVSNEHSEAWLEGGDSAFLGRNVIHRHTTIRLGGEFVVEEEAIWNLWNALKSSIASSKIDIGSPA